MIVPMQKVTLFISTRHRNAALRRLRKIGVVHIQYLKPPMSEDAAQLENELGTIDASLLTLENAGASGTPAPRKTADSRALVEEINRLSTERLHNLGIIEEKKARMDWFDRWGKISAPDLEELHRDNIYIRLYIADKSFLKKRPDNATVEILQEDKGLIYLALIAETEDKRLDLKEEPLPQEDYATTAADLKASTGRIREIDARLKKLTKYTEKIRALRREVEKQLEFARVISGMQDAEDICYLQGYCPADNVEKLMTASAEEGWGILSEEPEPTDNPPTLLKMSWWNRIIKPVFDFLGTVPGYREYDISKYFLVFFALFVAMIIGDAGYGFIFLLICLFTHGRFIKKKQALPLTVKLFYVLSLCTIGWGAITGNWFGAVRIASIPFIKSLTIPQLATFPELFPGLTVDPQQEVMFICFVIAIIQLGLANLMNFINALPGLNSIAHLGWLSLMAGLFLVVLNLVLGMDMPVFTVPMIAGGLIAIVVFSKQAKGVGFFKGLSRGLGGAFNTFLDAISSFSNIISYIRLFAVGMATVAIASSFNDIAAPMLKGFALPAGLLVLLIGHGLNIAMALLSVIVHGIRLNVLEFSGQLGMEWSGYEYNPFKESTEELKQGEIK